MTDYVPQSPETDEPSAVPDVSKEALFNLLKDGSSVLANSVRRVIDEAESWTDNYAAFGNVP